MRREGRAEPGDRSPREALALLAHALAHPERLLMLEILRDHGDLRPLTISEISQRVELDRFATSRHLGVLREAGLVGMVAEGTKRGHVLRADPFADIEEWAVGFTDLSPSPVTVAGGA